MVGILKILRGHILRSHLQSEFIDIMEHRWDTAFSKNTRVSGWNASLNNDPSSVTPYSSPLPAPYPLHLYNFSLSFRPQLKLHVPRGRPPQTAPFNHLLSSPAPTSLLYSKKATLKSSGERKESIVNAVETGTSMQRK